MGLCRVDAVSCLLGLQKVLRHTGDKMMKSFSDEMIVLLVSSFFATSCHGPQALGTLDQASPVSSSPSACCLRPQRVSFVPKESGTHRFLLQTAEVQAAKLDISDFALSLSPADLEHADSFACQGNTCDVSLVKPVTFRRDVPLNMAAKLFLRYEVSKDEKGAIVRREIVIGERKEVLSIGRIVGVDIEVGAFLRRDTAHGAATYAGGGYVKPSLNQDEPLIHFSGTVVDKGLKWERVTVKGRSAGEFLKSLGSAGTSEALTRLSKEAQVIRNVLQRHRASLGVGTPDVTWSALANRCPSEFASP